MGDQWTDRIVGEILADLSAGKISQVQAVMDLAPIFGGIEPAKQFLARLVRA